MHIRLTEEFYSDKTIARAYNDCKPNILGFLTLWCKLAKLVLQSGKPFKRDPKIKELSLVVEIDDSVIESGVFRAMRHVDMVRITEDVPPSLVGEDKYEEWFKLYPYRDRDGKKVKVRGKSKIRFFNEIRDEGTFQQLLVATREYGRNNKMPKDCERFLKDGFWKEYLPSSVQSQQVETKASSALTSDQVDEMLQ